MSKAINHHLHVVAEVESSTHSLQHFCATKLYQLTKDIRLVQRALAHASVSTTQVYSAPNMSRFVDAVARISFAPKIEIPPRELEVVG
jgi:site-specific recombinase XerD